MTEICIVELEGVNNLKVLEMGSLRFCKCDLSS